VLLADGISRFSMRRIAERIEYTPTTIYLYFKDKADLLFHLCEEVYGEVLEILESAEKRGCDPLERLRAGMRAYIDFGLAKPERYRIAFMSNITSNVDPTSFLKKGSKAYTACEILHRMVGETMEGKAIAEEDKKAAAQALWASGHGVVTLLIDYPDFPWVDRERLIETGIELMIDGIRAYKEDGAENVPRCPLTQKRQ
jgi:AcrR family transcriptional regulator